MASTPGSPDGAAGAVVTETATVEATTRTVTATSSAPTSAAPPTVTVTAPPPVTVTAPPPVTVTVAPPHEVGEGAGITCSGEYIVLVASVIGDDPAEVKRLQVEFPGARAAGTGVCSSMTQRSDDGRSITAVYFGPFATAAAACAVRADVGGDAQVRLMIPAGEPLGPQTC